MQVEITTHYDENDNMVSLYTDPHIDGRYIEIITENPAEGKTLTVTFTEHDAKLLITKLRRFIELKGETK